MRQLAMGDLVTPICVPSLSSRLVSRRSGATTINAVRSNPTSPFRHILASDLTKRIRAAIILHPDPAYTVADVSERSTRAGASWLSCVPGWIVAT